VEISVGEKKVIVGDHIGFISHEREYSQKKNTIFGFISNGSDCMRFFNDNETVREVNAISES